MHSRKEIQSPREVLLDLGPDGHMCTANVTLYPLGVGQIRGDNVCSPVIFFPLNVGKIKGDSGPNNRVAGPMPGSLGHLRTKDTLEG